MTRFHEIRRNCLELYLFIFYLFSFLLTINLKLIKVHIEIKIVNKEAATKRSTLLHTQRQLCMVAVLHTQRNLKPFSIKLINFIFSFRTY